MAHMTFEPGRSTDTARNPVTAAPHSKPRRACPAMVAKALSLVCEDEPDPRRLAVVIADDPVMVKLLIARANACALSRGVAVTSLRPAIERLGLSNTVYAMTHAALRSGFRVESGAFFEARWAHIETIAHAAGLVADTHGRLSPGLTRIQALLCHVDDLRLAPQSPADTGPHLLRSWNLPPPLHAALQHHGNANVYALDGCVMPGEVLSMVAATHMAERLVANLRGRPTTSACERRYARAVRQLGLCDAQVTTLHRAITP